LKVMIFPFNYKLNTGIWFNIKLKIHSKQSPISVSSKMSFG
jgi:hypothetical protein